jgi:hypothetical protein
VIEFFENLSGSGVPQPKWARAAPNRSGGVNPFVCWRGRTAAFRGPAEAKWGYTTLNVADWDNDGLLDIVFNSIWGACRVG